MTATSAPEVHVPDPAKRKLAIFIVLGCSLLSAIGQYLIKLGANQLSHAGLFATMIGIITIPQLFAGTQASMVNLETVITDNTCPEPQSKPYIFDAPASAITALKSVTSSNSRRIPRVHSHMKEKKPRGGGGGSVSG